MREVTASAPGKVNLVLRAGAPVPDGYHPLVSVFECLDVRETVTVRTTRAPGIHVATRAHRADGTPDEEASRALDALPPHQHLAVRAARLLQRLAASGSWAATSAGVSIVVDKRVPVAGGMAGGSADAAATLVACDRLWGLGLGPARLEVLGRTLGADVPACLTGGIALGTGRGDHMRVLLAGVVDGDGAAAAWPHHWAVALSHRGLSTPAVFRELDALGGPGGRWGDPAEPDAATVRLLTSPAGGPAGALVNDLEEAALRLRPELATTLAAAREAGALDVVLSGSGPSVAALARDEAHARELAAALRDAPAVDEVLVTRGPAQGTRIESGDDPREGRR